VPRPQLVSDVSGRGKAQDVLYVFMFVLVPVVLILVLLFMLILILVSIVGLVTILLVIDWRCHCHVQCLCRGMDFDGREHSGRDDARNITRIARALLQQGELKPESR